LEQLSDNQSAGTLPIEEANELVVEHQGWAESIARSVARAWGMDWKLDGLDGAAMEALIFCARRFQPGRGVPFKGYARKRIHEASTEAARKSKGWRKGVSSKEEQRSREVSAELLNIFPELRIGELPYVEDIDPGSEGGMRAAIRQLLMGATLVAARQGMEGAGPDQLLDYKRLIEVIADLEPIHQHLLWKVYWEGVSLRSLASEWDTDGLNVIREHKAVIDYLHKNLSLGKQFLTKPKVRPGLRQMSQEMKTKEDFGPFHKFLPKGSSNDKKGRR